MTTSHGRLTRGDFIDAAARFIDEHGEQAFTLRTLGDALGVDQSAVYRHFRDRAALVDAVQGWLFAEFDLPDPAVGEPRKQLFEGVMAIRRVLMQHPNLAMLTGRGDGLPDEISAAVWCLALLQRMGLAGHQRLVAYQLIESYVYGTCMYDATGGHDAMELRRRWYRTLGQPETDAVSRSVDTIRALSDEAFATGLHAVLDACDRLIQH